MAAGGAVVAMVLGDSRFPAGTHAHSLGLEQAVEDGLTVRDVPAFAAARMALVAEADAALAVAARRSVAADGPAAVDALSELHAARTPSHVLREQARRLGAQLLRSAEAVWPGDPIAWCRVPGRIVPRPVALGVVAAAAGLSDEDTARVALYDDAATVCSAALKLLPVDPAEAARWLVELAAPIAASASRIAGDRSPPERLQPPAAPALDIAASIHTAREERLFAT
jgi:urease accessory protein